MSDFKYPNEVYGVISEFDDEEQLAMALIVARKELDRTRKALDVAVERLKNIVLDVEVLATPEYLADRAKETLNQINEIKGGKDE